MELDTTVQLSARNLSCSFGGVRAVSELSCDLNSGAVTAFIGPNGAGKTTAFNLFSGFVKADTGGIEIAGQTATGLRPDRIAQLGLGRTFQDCKVFDQLSVLENVMLGYRSAKEETLAAALLQGQRLQASEKLRKHEALALLVDAGLTSKSGAQARDLSYGQRKLLELCRVRAFDPKVYLLDEPFAGLFPDIADKMGSIIKGLAEVGRAVVFIEHDMEAVSRLADRVLVLDFGRTIADGTPDEVLNDPAVLDAYLGRVGQDAP